MTNDKPLLRSVVPAGFDEIVADLALPSYRAAQLRQWVFGHGAMQWEQMSNLPGAMRQALSERFDLVGLHQVERQVSQDSTRKFLFELRDGNTIEAVIIPMAEHATFCLSTQVGCAMACRFCATARGGLVRNLTAGEIVEQVLHLRNDLQTDPLPQHGDRQFNVVFMGMGEPLDNWPALLDAVATLQNDDGLGMSRRRIQVSTSGPASGLRQLLASPLQIGLTVSLGGSTDNERRRVMPVPGRTPVSEVVDLATEYARTHNRKFTVAWVMIRGATDRPEQAENLSRLLSRRPCKVNLIPLNPVDDRDAAPEHEAVLAFQKILNDGGVTAFIRSSGGSDIDAACGQLRRRRERR